MTPVTVFSLMEFSEAQLDKLRAVSPQLDVHQLPQAAIEDIPDNLRRRVNVLYGWGKTVQAADQFTALAWVQTHTAGVNSLIGTPIWQQDVPITSLNGVAVAPVAEHALAMIMAFRWRLPAMFHFKGAGIWPKSRWDHFSGPELRGSTLGIIGYGAIGREVGRLAHGLGMRVLAVNRSGTRSPYRGYAVAGTGDPEAVIPERIFTAAELHAMLPDCDYVVCLTPLTPQTKYLFNAHTFSAMKTTAYYFNLARGGLVDEAALVEALQSGVIAGAGLDVFETEPLPPDSPLWGLDNLIISPHVSGFSPDYDERASDLFAENLRRFLADEPLLNLVERESGY